MVLLYLILAHVICVLAYFLATIMVGRLFRLSIEEASLFNGRTLIQFQFGDTRYRLNWLPLGNSVKFASDYESAVLVAKLLLILSGCGALI